MEKICPWCGQPSDRGRLKNGKEQLLGNLYLNSPALTLALINVHHHHFRFSQVAAETCPHPGLTVEYTCCYIMPHRYANPLDQLTHAQLDLHEMTI